MTTKKIRFVTDSTCDIPQDLIKEWGITVVPCFVNYGGNSYADDGVELVRSEFYDLLPSLHPSPTTAAPPPDLAKSLIQPVFEEADHVIIICVPAKLSAVYNSMRLAISDLPPERVTLIDSGQLSMGMGWQVLVGAEVAQKTGDVQQVIAAIDRVREASQLYAAIATMEYLRRSGRVSSVVAGVGQLLQIKPVVQVVEGDVLSVARVRTFKSATAKLVELIRAEAPLDRLALLHINNPEGIEDLKQQLGDLLPPDVLVRDVTPTLGAHLGLGCLGAATLNSRWKR